jgi:hypothetical protein
MMVIKRIAIIIIFFFLLAAPLAAFADALVDPDNNDFYRTNKDQIVYLGRSFSANGEKGNVAIKKEPGSSRTLTTIQNGDCIYLEYSCLYDGNFWGFTVSLPGWVEIDQMLVLYDFVAFDEEHAGEFYAYEGSYDEIEKTKSAVVWPWPGSGAPRWTATDINLDHFTVSHAWRDPDGREWGFVQYMTGDKNIWICLDEPMNQDIPAFNPEPAPTVWESDTVHKEINSSMNSTIILIIILVAALAIGTIILIKTVWRAGK